MKIAKELDYNLQAYQDRVGLVNYLDREGFLAKCSPGELDKVANYLLYSEDVEAEVELKGGSKKKVSYEALIESTIGENLVQSQNQASIYKVVRPSIDREKDADIPGMKDLWEAIDIIEGEYRYCKDVLDCKIPLDPDRKTIVTYQTKYFFREWMIELRRDQFLLKDAYKPTIGVSMTFEGYIQKPHAIGMKVGDYVMCDNSLMVDFGNWRHIYALLKFYAGMKAAIDDNVDHDWWEPYNFLEYLIERVRWSPEQEHILIRKIDRVPNETILAELDEMGKKTYSVNYISTIWKQHITKRIARHAYLYVKEKEHKVDGSFENMMYWKVCPDCGRTLYADEINFGKYQTGEWRETCKDCIYKAKLAQEERRRIRNERKLAKLNRVE